MPLSAFLPSSLPSTTDKQYLYLSTCFFFSCCSCACCCSCFQTRKILKSFFFGSNKEDEPFVVDTIITINNTILSVHAYQIKLNVRKSSLVGADEITWTIRCRNFFLDYEAQLMKPSCYSSPRQVLKSFHTYCLCVRATVKRDMFQTHEKKVSIDVFRTGIMLPISPFGIHS